MSPALAPVTPARWRLLITFDRPGWWHMAIDEALHTLFRHGQDRPVLRLYTWQPACLSLGFAQPIADIDLAACTAYGLDLVRRSTGGRAVLHEHEVAYSVIAPLDDPLVGGTITHSYSAIARSLVAGLELLGVAACLAPGAPAGDLEARRSGACFAAATRCEIVWAGRKLAGSAQRRRGGMLLQHGSIRLAPGRSIGHLLHRVPAGALDAHLKAATATVADALGVVPDPRAVAASLHAGFAAALGIALEPSDLTAEEISLASSLAADRYRARDWTARR